MFLTKSRTPVIGWFAVALGFIMNLIFNAQSAIGIENIGLCIILFTIIIYMLMMPLTIQQQKFSKLQAKMSPELQAIQKKYKGKNSDQAAMQRMNEETQAIYAKYGVNPMGSCLQMLIQLPLLFALYRVIWNIPAYVDKVKNVFIPLATKLLDASGAEAFLSEASKSAAVSFKEMNLNTVIDVLYKFKPANWAALSDKFPDMSDLISNTQTSIDRMNNFLGLNIADSPFNIMKSAFFNRQILLLIGAVSIPVLAALTQWLNTKLMTGTNDNQNQEGGSMADSMKMMNTMMPIMSLVFCLTLPVGMGIYWIAGAVVRSVQQVMINRRIDSIDVDELVKQNLEKMNQKRAKQGLPPEKMNNNARISTRNINVESNKTGKSSMKARLMEEAAKAKDIPESSSSSGSSTAPKKGSLAAKANMVKEYNDRHQKK